MTHLKTLLLFSCSTLLGTVTTYEAYLTDYTPTSGAIYLADLNHGNPTTFTTIPLPPGETGQSLSGIALANSKTAYVVGIGTGSSPSDYIYQVDLTHGTLNTVSQLPSAMSEYFAITFSASDPNTAYVAAQGLSDIYKFDLTSTFPVTPEIITPTFSGSVTLSGIAVVDHTAYIVDAGNRKIYSIDLTQSSPPPTVVSTSVPYPWDIVIPPGSKTAYLTAGLTPNQDSVYSLDLTNGQSSLIVQITNSSLFDLAVTDDGTKIYLGDFSNNQVYEVDVVNQQYMTVNQFTNSPELAGIAIVALNSPSPISQISTTGLYGNNSNLANYINNSASPAVVQLFAPLQGNALEQALQSAAPTRNAYPTYMAQNAALSFSTLLSDHLRWRSFHPIAPLNRNLAASTVDSHHLFVDGSDQLYTKESWECDSPCSYKPMDAWVGGFGEYVKEEAQNQTPGFHAELGGVIAGFDYRGTDSNVIGGGAAYAYVHLKTEDGSQDADVNQGFLTVYGTLNACHWYLDLTLWGGYYRINNLRTISFPGFFGEAKGKSDGWQLTPHVELGYDGFRADNCIVKPLGIEPFAMLDVVNNWESAMKENGAGVLNMGQKQRYSAFLRAETGFRFHQTIERCFGRIVFFEKGSYAFRKTFGTGQITSFLVGSPGSFSVTTFTEAQNVGIGEFAMLFVSTKKYVPYLHLSYQGEFGSKYQSHQGKLTIGKDF